MTRATAVCLALLLAACAAGTGDDAEPTPVGREVATTTTGAPEAVPSTTIAVSTTTTTAPADDGDDGAESIGVTDEVTIVVVGP